MVTLAPKPVCTSILTVQTAKSGVLVPQVRCTDVLFPPLGNVFSFFLKSRILCSFCRLQGLCPSFLLVLMDMRTDD